MSLSVLEPPTTARLDSGLTAAIETVPGCRSVAVCLLLPMGLRDEPGDLPGVAALAEEWVFRGAGELNNKSFNHALDRLGAQRHTHLDARYLQVSAVCVNDQLPAVLERLGDLAMRPRLDDADFEPVRALCRQSLQSLQDEPEERIGLLLRSQFQPAPFNRSPYGQAHGLEQATADDVRAFVHQHAQPNGAILSIAGGIAPPHVWEAVQKVFGAWSQESESHPNAVAPNPTDHRPSGATSSGGASSGGASSGGASSGGVAHEAEESQQTHICVGLPSRPETDPQTLPLKVGLACLSGGASGRLFTEVREKRGLCYAVSAGYAGDQDRGGVFLYAGTTPPRAQETLDVMLAETRRVEEGIAPQEFDRAKTTLLSRLVMHGESTEARASSLARDLAVFGRPRPLEERANALRSLTLEETNQALSGLTRVSPTLATLGPDPLTPPGDWMDGCDC